MIHKVMKENMSVEDYLKNNIVYKKNLLKKKLRNKTASEISELYQANKLLTRRIPRELRAHCKERAYKCHRNVQAYKEHSQKRNCEHQVKQTLQRV